MDWLYDRLPLILLLIFLLPTPLLLSPADYGLLATCTGALGVLFFYRERPVNLSILRAGTICVIVVLLSAVSSGYFWNGLEYALVVATAVVLLALLGRQGACWSETIALFVGSVGLLFLVEVGLQYAEQISLFGWYGLPRLPSGPFRNPNVMGRVFGLVAVVCLVARKTAWLRYGLFGLFTVSVVMSGSRGAMLALLLAGGYFFLQGRGWRNLSRVWLIVIGGVGLVVTILLVGWPTYVTNLQRIQLVIESLLMASESPWLGVGGWNFGLVYPSVSLDGQWQRHAHSFPFMILAEFGLIGFAAGVFIVLTLWYSKLRVRWIPVLVFVLVHELVDTMIWIPGVLIVCAIALLPLGYSGRRKESSSLLVVLASFTLIFGFITYGTNWSYTQSRVKKNPVESILPMQVETVAGFPAFNAVAQRVRKGEAIRLDRLAKILNYNQYDPYYYWFTGQLLQENGNRTLARASFKRYVKMDPHGMLGLGRTSLKKSVHAGSQPLYTYSKTPSLGTVIEHPRKPSVYVPVILRSLRNQKYETVLNQIDFLATFPKTDRSLISTLDQIHNRIRTRRPSLNVETKLHAPTESLSSRRRQQFHRFFYRRPGDDYVSFH